LSAATNSRQARFRLCAYVWRFRYDSTARRNSSAIGAPVLRDSLCSRSSSCSGSQTVVRFFMPRYCDVCHYMSSAKCTHIENKYAELASPCLAESANNPHVIFTRSFPQPHMALDRANVGILRRCSSPECRLSEPELSGPRCCDDEDAPGTLRAHFFFIFFSLIRLALAGCACLELPTLHLRCVNCRCFSRKSEPRSLRGRHIDYSGACQPRNHRSAGTRWSPQQVRSRHSDSPVLPCDA
jgi:hypothetical protein